MLHFHPIVPPALPETTMKCSATVVPRSISVTAEYTVSMSAHGAREMFVAKSAILDDGLPPDDDHTLIEKVDADDEPFASFALRMRILTDFR